jgi:hypothetical protein
MTYTSRLFDAHKTVIESFIIEQDGLDNYKNIKFAPKLSEAKIKYAMLERLLEIVGAGVDIAAVTNIVESDKQEKARAILAAREMNHVPADVMIVDEIPSYQELEADLVGTL